MGNDQIGTVLITHIASLRRYARSLVGNASDADDLVQECLTRALSKGLPWDRIANMKAYLFTILHNIHLDKYRRARTTGTEVSVDAAGAMLSYPAPQHRRMELSDLAIAMTRLSEDQKQVVLLVAVEGMSYAEAATVLGVPVGTVMSRLARGRETLRQLTSVNSTTNLRIVKK